MFSSHQKQAKVNKKKLYKYKKCNEYNTQAQKLETKLLTILLGILKVIVVLLCMTGKMEFVPYDQFKKYKIYC
ncbi:hypothetical protein RhiirA1_485562 [Rhizophagus irregularis]|uniref:Uncharacterized protein n=1 Tax=Rhizophagus irregularis TaxID=588596 RepID=A0A2N0QI31_9GLOM|nr:hypothetical protein RhiirA1_485562 [Rhizophagus irregularis]